MSQDTGQNQQESVCLPPLTTNHALTLSSSLSFCPWGAEGAAAYNHTTQEFVFAPVNASSTIIVKE